MVEKNSLDFLGRSSVTKSSSVSVVSVQCSSINVSLYKILLQQRVHGTNACVCVQWMVSKDMEKKAEKE